MKLTVKELTYTYRGGHTALRNISFAARQGELLSVLGPNGAGKSTLFRCILGGLPDYGGAILLDGRDARTLDQRALAAHIAYIPQIHRPTFGYSVLDTVLMGGVNDDEIEDFLNLTKEHPWEVRFIELMPMGPCAAWPKERFLPVTEILNRFPALEEIEPNGVARRYRLPGAMGTVGLITPMSHEFCGACRRIRVTADGKLKGCLHSREEISLRGLHGRELEDAILRGILHKPRGHHLTEHASDTPRTMNEIGG